MRKKETILIIIFLLSQQFLLGQSTEKQLEVTTASEEWSLLMNTSMLTANTNDLWEALDMDEYINFLQRKRTKIKSDRLFLNHLFYKTHRKFLHDYKQYSSVVELGINGDYDCVSGTLFYAFILNRLNIPYYVKEFDYHVMMIVKLNGKEYLFEATDPLGGYVTDQTEIEDRIQFYVNDMADPSWLNQPIGNNDPQDLESGMINNEISFKKLIGLQYFNNAVFHFNNKEVAPAILAFENALKFYNSDRIKMARQLALIEFMRHGLLTEEQQKKYFDLIFQPVSSNN